MSTKAVLSVWGLKGHEDEVKGVLLDIVKANPDKIYFDEIYSVVTKIAGPIWFFHDQTETVSRWLLEAVEVVRGGKNEK